MIETFACAYKYILIHLNHLLIEKKNKHKLINVKCTVYLPTYKQFHTMQLLIETSHIGVMIWKGSSFPGIGKNRRFWLSPACPQRQYMYFLSYLWCYNVHWSLSIVMTLLQLTWHVNSYAFYNENWSSLIISRLLHKIRIGEVLYCCIGW